MPDDDARLNEGDCIIKRFFSYVEIKTKITSIFAFMLTIAFLIYRERHIDWKKSIIFFLSMFLFDLTTTAINNYIDTKTNDQVLQFRRRNALIIIYVLFAASSFLGLYLAYITDIVVLLVGGLCFLCGVFYTYGPVPFSRLPLGELLSGIFYGFFIPFLIMYINAPVGTFIEFYISMEKVTVHLMLYPIAAIVLLSIIPVCTTANIMLANNICDIERDKAVKRYTLPYYISRKSLYLFAFLYYMTYASMIIMVVLRILSPVLLLTLLTIWPVQSNINVFLKKQVKSETFVSAIKNYVIIMGADTLLIFISALL